MAGTITRALNVLWEATATRGKTQSRDVALALWNLRPLVANDGLVSVCEAAGSDHEIGRSQGFHAAYNGTAACTLQTVNQQIQQLQNEAQMLVNMGKNLTRIDFPQLDALKQKLAEIDRLMGRAQAIDFRVDQLDDKFQSLYRQDFSSVLRTDARVRDARSRLDASMGAFRQTMTVQAQVYELIQSGELETTKVGRATLIQYRSLKLLTDNAGPVTDGPP